MAEQWQEEICYWEGCALSCRIRRIPGSVPVVFLPGVGECQSRWERQFEALKDHTVLTLDWRLHGNSRPYTLSGSPIEIKPFSIPQAVKDLRQILRQSELQQSVLVIGAGGGPLLQEYQAQFQDALGYGVVGEEGVDGLESLPPTQSALLEFVARCTPPPPLRCPRSLCGNNWPTGTWGWKAASSPSPRWRRSWTGCWRRRFHPCRWWRWPGR